MTQKKWMFWLHKEHEELSSSPSLLIDNGACREWTPFLTSLFDGEADTESALQARRHLLVCERCARTWFDWNQTRNLLQNHSAPPPPPNLLWRIRLACRMGQPQPQRTPELSAQIFARTSRPSVGTSLQAQLNAALRGLRVHTPLASALALGAFIVLLSRDSLFTATSLSPDESRLTPIAASTVRSQSLQASPVVGSDSDANSVLTPYVRRTQPVLSLKAIPSASASTHETSALESSLATLNRARRERETLKNESTRPVSYDLSEPLPMLQAPRSRRSLSPSRRSETRRTLPPALLASLPDNALRPIASAPRTAMPTVVLASFSFAPNPVTTSSSRDSRPVRPSLMSSSSGAPLRISAPHALPITVSNPIVPDDSDLDDLDSTVQAYRASVSDDTSDFANDTN